MGGGAEPVPLGQLKDQLQTMRKELSEVQQREQAIAEREKQVEQIARQGMAQAQQVPQQILAAASNMQALKNAHDSYDWETLNKTDPAKYSSLKLRFQEAMGKAQQDFMQAQQVVSQETQKQLVEERTKLLGRVREWRDPKVLAQDWQTMQSTLAVFDMTPQDLNQIRDHRVLAAFHRLAQLEQHGKAAESTMQQVRKSPRGLRTGALRPVRDKKGATAAKLAQRAKQTKSKADIHAAQKSLLQLGGLI